MDILTGKMLKKYSEVIQARSSVSKKRNSSFLGKMISRLGNNLKNKKMVENQ